VLKGVIINWPVLHTTPQRILRGCQCTRCKNKRCVDGRFAPLTWVIQEDVEGTFYDHDDRPRCLLSVGNKLMVPCDKKMVQFGAFIT